MAELALRQATIEYQEFGPKDSPHAPVLFVHGILVDGRLWREVAEGLARRGFRCIVPTWPLGSHTIPVNKATALSLPGVAQMINDAILALDLSDVTLVGRGALPPCVGHAQSRDVPGGSEMIQPDGKEELSRRVQA